MRLSDFEDKSCYTAESLICISFYFDESSRFQFYYESILFSLLTSLICVKIETRCIYTLCTLQCKHCVYILISKTFIFFKYREYIKFLFTHINCIRAESVVFIKFKKYMPLGCKMNRAIFFTRGITFLESERSGEKAGLRKNIKNAR